MTRKELLKGVLVGAGVALVPSVLKASPAKAEKGPVRLAIDVEAISHFTFSGRAQSPVDILNIYNETGILIYDSHYGNTPLVIEGEIEVVDMSKIASQG